MMIYIGQALGIIATACCAVLPLFRKKWMMLMFSLIANILFATNQIIGDRILLGTFSSAALLYIVTVVQTLLMMWHVHKDSKVTLVENIIFLAIYVICGIIGREKWQDIHPVFSVILSVLPILGSAFSMFSTFQRDEQRTRLLIFFNAICWASYFLIRWPIGGTLSTNVFAELLATTTSAIGLIKYGLEKRRAQQ